MVNVIKQEVRMEELLRKRLEFICEFCSVKPIIINVNLRTIEIVRGTSSPLDDVKELYLSEFEEARLEYNFKQSRPSRMIDNYFDNVSNNEKKDLACEIILELGDKEYWDTKD